MKMEQENLKHAKKHWHNGSFYFKDMIHKQYASGGQSIKYSEVEMYISNRSVVMNCYNVDVVNTLLRVDSDEKIKVWFSTESKNHNGRWYTNNTIKYIEVPRLIQMDKMKKEYIGSNGFNFDKNNEDF